MQMNSPSQHMDTHYWSSITGVDQPNVSDHHRRADAGPGDVSEPSNGHITHNGNELNAIVEGQKKASMQMERGL